MWQFLKLIFNDKLTGTASYGKVFGAPFLVAALFIGVASGVQQIKKGEGVVDIVLTLGGLGITMSGLSKGLSIAGNKVQLNNNSNGA